MLTLIPKVQLLVKEERLRSAFERYENVNLEICTIDPDSDDLDIVESRFLETLAKLNFLSILTNNRCHRRHTRFLDNIRNPLKFCTTLCWFTRYTDRLSICLILNALVHNNSWLENVQKLIYLRSFLHDEPLDLIKNLPIISNIYLETCKLLCLLR